MADQLIHKELSESIIGAAMVVLNALKPGLDEKLYERALAIELRKRGHYVQTQVEYPVFYDNERVGLLIPDMVVDQTIIVDTKVVSAFNETHLAQMPGYPAITDLRVALLLNFKYAKLQWQRVVRQPNPFSVPVREIRGPQFNHGFHGRARTGMQNERCSPVLERPA